MKEINHKLSQVIYNSIRLLFFIQVLSELSLTIPSGKTVALVGPSGCGSKTFSNSLFINKQLITLIYIESTIIQLIQRFYDPDHGQILLDGKDLKTLNVAWLRSHIGIVSQEPVLFTGTIEDNIRFGKPNATDEEVQNAAKMANAHDFIMTLPQVYSFPINYKNTLSFL
jgi:ABC-type multidrug transport system fused ATPase/permease subunit